MVPTGQMPQSRYIVKDSEGRLATSYNLGFGKALALRWAKLACQELKGQILLHSNENPLVYKLIAKYDPNRNLFD